MQSTGQRPSRLAVASLAVALAAVVPVCVLTNQYSHWDFGVLAVLAISAVLSELTATAGAMKRVWKAPAT